MKNLVKNIFIIIILVLLFIKRPIIISNIINGIDLWKRSVFPSIFPIIIISDLILSSNLINIISNIFGPLFSKIFKLSKYSSYVFLMSLLSGSPTNAKYILDLLNNKAIDNKEAIKVLSMSLNYNPLLILSITTYLKYEDRLYLIIVNIISNLIIGLFNRNYKCNINNNSIKSKKFNIVESINNSINILLLILGSIITFITLSSIIPIKHPLISGILEITNGLNIINNIDYLYKYKMIFTSILMGFGGFSILIQIKSIFKDTSLDYSLYYKSRIIHIIIMILFCYVRLYF